MGRTVVALALAVLLATLEAPALAQVYPPDPKPISISRSVVNPGDAITVSGEQADAGSELSLEFFPGPRELATTTAGADGRWSVEVTIPDDASPGRHALSAVSNGEVLATAVVEVRGPAGEVAGESTSSGGRRPGLLILGIAALAIGIAVVLLVWRQRHRLRV
jgi:5'-nucleotidase